MSLNDPPQIYLMRPSIPTPWRGVEGPLKTETDTPIFEPHIFYCGAVNKQLNLIQYIVFDS